MPSKNNSNKKKKDNDEDLKQEGNLKLQAVLLADAVFGSKVTAREDYQSFGLRPWSSEASTSSQILCPINNVPLVDYILDFLASNGVEQVIIILGSCATSTVSGSGSSDVAAVYSNSFYTYYPARRRSDGGLDSGRNRPYSPLQQPTMHRSSQNIVPQNLMDYYLQMTVIS